VQEVYLILYAVNVGSSSSTQLPEQTVIVFILLHPFTHDRSRGLFSATHYRGKWGRSATLHSCVSVV